MWYRQQRLINGDYNNSEPPIFLAENICIGNGKSKRTGFYNIEKLTLDQFNLCRKVLGKPDFVDEYEK